MAVLNHTREPVSAADQTAADQTAAERATVEEPRAASPRRAWIRRRRSRVAAAGAAAGTGTVLLIARVIRLVTAIVVLLIGLGILFVALKASPSNTIVSHIHSWAHWLVGPFRGMFQVHGARGTLALNWGIALVVYLLIGWTLSRAVLAPARVFRRRATAAPVA
jgi:hypothetical protein